MAKLLSAGLWELTGKNNYKERGGNCSWQFYTHANKKFYVCIDRIDGKFSVNRAQTNFESKDFSNLVVGCSSWQQIRKVLEEMGEANVSETV